MEKKKLKKSNEISFLTEGELDSAKGGMWWIGVAIALGNAMYNAINDGAEENREGFEGTTGVSYDLYLYGGIPPGW